MIDVGEFQARRYKKPYNKANKRRRARPQIYKSMSSLAKVHQFKQVFRPLPPTLLWTVPLVPVTTLLLGFYLDLLLPLLPL